VLGYIRQAEDAYPGRLIAVVIPELVKQHWWQHLLHVHRAQRLRQALMQHAGSRLAIVNLRWRLDPLAWTDLPDGSEA
jgi:hypothetical protein